MPKNVLPDIFGPSITMQPICFNKDFNSSLIILLNTFSSILTSFITNNFGYFLKKKDAKIRKKGKQKS